MFGNFQFDNNSMQRNVSFDSASPSPSTPSSASKAFMNSPTYGNNDSGFYNARSDSPLQDIGSPAFETEILADIMNYLNVNQTASAHQPEQQHHYETMRNDQQGFQNDMKPLQALSMLQQQQFNMAVQPLNQIFQQQLLSRFNQLNWLQQQQQQQQQSMLNNANSLDHAAKYHRSSAALYDASCTWSGVLPPRVHRLVTYSPKVFLGGIPWDVSEQSLMQSFRPFGQIRIDWPGKEQNAVQPKGYVYVIFESEKQVKALLQACNMQGNFPAPFESIENGSCAVLGNSYANYYYKISSKRIKEKDVEVIPWIIGESNYIKSANQKIESTKTVFVGALHGKLTAEGLAKVMNDLFDGVIYAGIDTDKYKYPIGSGRVTFNNTRSYMRAVAAAFIEIKTSKFTKKVQIDPYLEDSLCSVCSVQHGPYYCRELSCFRYFCRQCWQSRHSNDLHLRNHKPLTRNSKSQQQIHSTIFHGSSTSSGCSMSSNPGSPNSDQISLLNFQLK